MPGAPHPLIGPEIQRRLLALRLILILLEILGLTFLDLGLEVELPHLPLAALIGLHLLLAASAALRLKTGRDAWPAEIFVELCADAGVMSALVYFCGGFANPFISLLLVPLLLAVTVLPEAWAWAMAALTVGLYSLLAHFYRPLILPVSAGGAVDLHLTGMWLNFILTVILLTAFMVRLARALRRREETLAAERERALRDEQLFLLGMQAASAAHDLATPLATVRLGLENMRDDYRGDDEISPGLDRLIRQTERMQATLGRIAAAAGATRAGDMPAALPLDVWIRETLEHWQLMRPQARLALSLPGLPATPPAVPEPAWVSLFTTLLNNAADADPGVIEVNARYAPGALVIAVRDRGAGFIPGKSKSGQETSGWGIGLKLAEAHLERLGGRLETGVAPSGGTVVTLHLPVPEWHALNETP